VQILVVVAITQLRTLRVEVEKGSMITSIVHGLDGPKIWSNFGYAAFAARSIGNVGFFLHCTVAPW